MRVGEAVHELRQVLALAIVQVKDGHCFCLGLVLVGQVDIHPRVGHLAGGQHDEIGLYRDLFVEDQVVEIHPAGVTCRLDLGGTALGEDHALLLGAAVEVLAHAGHAQVRVHHDGVDFPVGILEVHRLLDAGGATMAGAVGQVSAALVPLAGALNENDGIDLMAVAAFDRCAIGTLCQGFKTGLVDDVGQAAAELRQLVHVVAGETAGLDDGTDFDDLGWSRSPAPQ